MQRQSFNSGSIFTTRNPVNNYLCRNPPSHHRNALVEWDFTTFPEHSERALHDTHAQPVPLTPWHKCKMKPTNCYPQHTLNALLEEVNHLRSFEGSRDCGPWSFWTSLWRGRWVYLGSSCVRRCVRVVAKFRVQDVKPLGSQVNYFSASSMKRLTAEKNFSCVKHSACWVFHTLRTGRSEIFNYSTS